jgi:hypothetical protein
MKKAEGRMKKQKVIAQSALKYVCILPSSFFLSLP